MIVFMNPLDKAIQLCGGLSALAEKIGTSSARLGNWRVRGVPVESCFLIEQATNGLVTRKDLRPDDWQKIWPELADAPAIRHRDAAPDPGPDKDEPPTRHNLLECRIDQPVVPERPKKK